MGDGDGLEWGQRLPNGQWLYHPPGGPAEILPRGFVTPTARAAPLAPRWRRLWPLFGRRRHG